MRRGLNAPARRRSFTGERRTEEGDSGLGPLIYTKANPIPLAATDGAPTC